MTINLRRITTSGRILPEIDGLRFIAIALVLTSHTWGNWVPYSGDVYDLSNLAWYERLMQDLLLQGKLGVFLFFSVSGFILVQPWLEHGSINLKSFYIRRLTRLEPPYIIAMTGYFLSLCWIGRLDPLADLPHLLASLTYTHNIIYDAPSVIYMAAWSLEVEFQFYLLSPLIFSQLIRFSPIVRILLLIAGIGFFASLPSLSPGLPDTLLHYFHFFLVGILLAQLKDIRGHVFQDLLKRYDLLAIAGICILLFAFPKLDTSWSGQFGYCVGISLIIFAAFTGKNFHRFLVLPFIAVTGGMCYSIYLLHARLLTAAYVYIMEGLTMTGIYFVDPFLMILMMLPGVLLICTIFYVLIERPTMDPHWPERIKQAFFRRQTLPKDNN